MKNVKRIIVLILCVVMLAGVVACNGDTPDNGTTGGDTGNQGSNNQGNNNQGGSNQGGNNQGGNQGTGTGSRDPATMTADDWEALRLEERTLTFKMVRYMFSDALWDWFMEDFQNLHPNWTVIWDLEDAWDSTVIQAELLMGTPRTFAAGNWDFTANTQLAMGVMLPVTAVLDSPSFDNPGMTVRDTIAPGAQFSVLEGEDYHVPYRFGADGFWYNVQMFEDNGWTEPQTWSEFLALSQQMLDKGITPLMFTATFSPYPWTMLMYPRGAALGGRQWAYDFRNLEDGIWDSNTTRQVINDFLSLRELGVYTDDVLGTDYLMAQQLFFEGKSAMVLSGTWLEVEMQEVIPEGFRFAFMPAPVKQNRSDPAFVTATSMAWSLYRGSGEELEGMQMIRYLLSERFMQKYAELDGHTTIHSTVVDLSNADLSPAGMTVFNTMNRSDIVIIPNDTLSLVSAQYVAFCDGIMGIMAGNENIDNLLSTAAAAVREAKADPDFSFAKME